MEESIMNNFKKTKWTNEELNTLKELYLSKTIKEISKILNRSPSAIKTKKWKLGITGYVQEERKYYYNKDFFKNINSEEKAYWLGFIAADGGVYYQPQNCCSEVTIKLKSTDFKHLKKFNKSLEGNLPVTFAERICSFNNKPQHSCQIRIYSKKMAEDLINLGMCQNKTFVLSMPSISSELYSHFIRGYFDGDGCIALNSKKRKDLQVNFCSASLKFLEQIREILYQNNISSYIIDENNKTTYRLYVKGLNNCNNMINYMFGNCSIYLDRKLYKLNALYKKYDIQRRLLPHSEMSGFLFSEKEIGKAEMPIRVEGCA